MLRAYKYDVGDVCVRMCMRLRILLIVMCVYVFSTSSVLFSSLFIVKFGILLVCCGSFLTLLNYLFYCVFLLVFV
jgi:hypothetical protein